MLANQQMGMGGIPPPPGSMGDLADTTDQMSYLPEVNVFRSSVILSAGLTVRYVAACGVWTGLRYAYWHLKNAMGKQAESPQKRNKRLKRDGKIWARSFGLDLLASFVFPQRTLSARTVPRLLLDFTFPNLGNVISAIDLFSPPHYLAFAMEAFRPFDAETSDFSYWSWQLPGTLLTIGKFAYRLRRHGAQKTKVKSCIAAILGQFAIRGIFGLMAPSLPMNIYELVVGALITGVDKWLQAFLARNTDPWIIDEDEREEAEEAKATGKVIEEKAEEKTDSSK